MDELTRPRHFGAQTSILGSMLIDPRCVAEVLERVNEEDFSYDSLREIFACIHRLFNAGETIDPVVVDNRLDRRYTETLADLMRLTPTAANALVYCDVLREEADLMRLRAVAENILSARNADEARKIYADSMQLAARRSRWRRAGIRDALNSLLDRLNDPAQPQFICWGIPVLDANLHVKANCGKFVVIGAESSVGKTAFALQLAFSMAATGKRVGFYSLETDEETAYDRVFVQQAKIKLAELQRKNVTENELRRLVELGDGLSRRGGIEMEIIECAGATASEIRTDVLIHRFDAAIIDYVQLMHAKGDERPQIVTNISMELHTLAQELGILVVGLSQLTPPQGMKYDPYRLNRKESLRESKQLVNDADVIMIMSRTSQEDPNFRELVIDKNKDGPCGTVQLDFHPEYMRFEPHANTRSEQYRNAMAASARARKAREQVSFDELGEGEGGENPFVSS